MPAAKIGDGSSGACGDFTAEAAKESVFRVLYEGVAPLAGFLCGNPGMRREWAFSRRILAAGIALTLGSTWGLIHIFGTQH
jgi:hypothetical protein